MQELEKQIVDEILDGLENDITYEKTGNEGAGVKTLKNPKSERDKSYDQGGFSTQQPTTGTMSNIREKHIILTKNDILNEIKRR